jgi:hypothetical protein
MGQQQSQGGAPGGQRKDDKKPEEKKEKKPFEPYTPPAGSKKKLRKGAGDLATRIPVGTRFSPVASQWHQIRLTDTRSLQSLHTRNVACAC